MTVTLEESFVTYPGDGDMTDFPVPFTFPTNAALVVTLAGVVQTLGVHYVVAGAGQPAGGTVTMLAAPADGDELVIERRVPLKQLTPFRDQGSFSPAVHEAALDYVTYGLQQVQRGVDLVADDVEAVDARIDSLVLDVAAAMVPPGGITATQLADASVTTAKLADAGVTTAKLANTAVTRGKLPPVGQQISPVPVGTSSTTSTTYVVANPGGLTVTLTTTGRPVVVGLMPDGTGLSSVSIYAPTGAMSAGMVAFSINGGASYFAETNISTQGDGGGGGSSVVVPPGAFNTLWVPAAGTYTITVHFRVSVGTATLGLTRVRLFAYEL